jgi:ketosteroid isomerase-like protein
VLALSILAAKLNGMVKLGRYVTENPELRFQDIAQAKGQVGYEFSPRFAVTLDSANRRIQLTEKPSPPNRPATPMADAKQDAAQNEGAHLRRIVDECNRRSIESFKKGDMRAVARDYADDAAIYFPRGQKVHGRQAIDRYWLGVKGAKDWRLETIEVGGTRDAIYELGKSTRTTVVDGKENTYVCAYVVIWKPQEGRPLRGLKCFNVNSTFRVMAMPTGTGAADLLRFETVTLPRRGRRGAGFGPGESARLEWMDRRCGGARAAPPCRSRSPARGCAAND